MIQVADYRFKYREREQETGTTVIIEVRIKGKRWRKSTGIVVPKGSLSQASGRIRKMNGLSPNQVKYINSQLAKRSMKAERIFIEHADYDLPLTLEKFKRAFNLPDAITLKDFAEIHIERETYKPTTRQQLRRAVELVEAAYKGTVTLFDLEQAPHQLEKYMVQIGLAFNTRQKYQGRLKTIIRSAIRNGYQIPDPYQHFKVHRIKGTRTFLEADELERLIRMHNTKSLPIHLHKSLETFLFSCYTGLRFSDMMEISHKNLVGGDLHFRPVKGQRFSQQLRIPLPDLALDIVEGRQGKLFKNISSQKMNVNLKRLMRLANINKHVTFHCARHTFGTLFIAIGGELMVLKELMGHSKISTTTDYVKMASGVKKNQIKLFDDRFNHLKEAKVRFLDVLD